MALVMKQSLLTESGPLCRKRLATLVLPFYDDMRTNALQGPVFEPVLAERWEAHQARMVEFWSPVALGSKSISGMFLTSTWRSRASRRRTSRV